MPRNKRTGRIAAWVPGSVPVLDEAPAREAGLGRLLGCGRSSFAIGDARPVGSIDIFSLAAAKTCAESPLGLHQPASHCALRKAHRDRFLPIRVAKQVTPYQSRRLLDGQPLHFPVERNCRGCQIRVRGRDVRLVEPELIVDPTRKTRAAAAPVHRGSGPRQRIRAHADGVAGGHAKETAVELGPAEATFRAPPTR